MKKATSVLAVALSGLFALTALVILNPLGGLPSGSASADNLNAKPWIFVGNPGDCGAAAGSNIVTSGWLGGLGLADNTSNSNAPRDAHRGLLLSKNGPTTDCSSAGATISGARGMTVDAAFSLGFDYRYGGHCGGGAPRFNVTYDPPSGPRASSFVGNCATGTQTPSTQDPEWMTLRFGAASQFPPIPAGSHIRSIDIVFDEGTDQAGVSDPNGVGLATIDNIFINGQTVRTGNGIAEANGPRNDRHDKDKGDDTEHDRD